MVAGQSQGHTIFTLKHQDKADEKVTPSVLQVSVDNLNKSQLKTFHTLGHMVTL